MKYCIDCNKLLPLEAFHKWNKTKDGYHYYCKACRKIRAKIYDPPKSKRKWKLKKPRRSANYEAPPAGQSWCAPCQSFKPLEEFPKSKSRRFGVDAYCHVCRRAYRKERWRGEGGRKIVEGVYFRSLKRRYGMSKDEYLAMHKSQKGKCAICGCNPKIFYRGQHIRHQRLHVDHDHETGKIRALLCKNCNHGLGFWQDKPTALSKAILYLKKHKIIPVTIEV